MKNDQFSFKRFIMLLCYELKFRVPNIAIAFIVLSAIIHVIYFVFFYWDTTFQPTTREPFVWSIIVAGSFYFPFAIYSQIRKKSGRAQFILLPTTTMEKFASMLTISLIIVPTLFILSCFLLDFTAFIMMQDRYIDFLPITYKIVKEFSILLFCSVAVAVLGNLVFKRMALFKTLLVTFVITSLYCILVTNQWFKEIIESADFNTELSNFVFISRIIYTCISIVLYLVAYYRIKKIQAI